jgi:hypothetical protein
MDTLVLTVATGLAAASTSPGGASSGSDGLLSVFVPTAPPGWR